jgi:hypothetical protein
MIIGPGTRIQAKYVPTVSLGSAAFISNLSELQFLYIENTLAAGASPVTYECWFYQIGSINNKSNTLFSTRTGYYDVGGIQLYLNGGYYNIATRGGFLLASGVPVTTNVWNHVAITIAAGAGSNSGTLWVNGVNCGTFTPPSLDSTDLYIGGGFFNGYITNFRYTYGAVVYNTIFPPPTAPLTNIAGTVVLLQMQSNSNLLTDSSGYGTTILNNEGTVTYSSNSPFALTDAPQPFKISSEFR